MLLFGFTHSSNAVLPNVMARKLINDHVAAQEEWQKKMDLYNTEKRARDKAKVIETTMNK